MPTAFFRSSGGAAAEESGDWRQTKARPISTGLWRRSPVEL